MFARVGVSPAHQLRISASSSGGSDAKLVVAILDMRAKSQQGARQMLVAVW